MAMRVVLVKGVLRHARVLVSLLPKKVSKQLSMVNFCPFVTKNSIKNRLKTTDRLKTPLFTLVMAY